MGDSMADRMVLQSIGKPVAFEPQADLLALARENRLPIIVFSIHENGAIPEVVHGRGRFTLVTP